MGSSEIVLRARLIGYHTIVTLLSACDGPVGVTIVGRIASLKVRFVPGCLRKPQDHTPHPPSNDFLCRISIIVIKAIGNYVKFCGTYMTIPVVAEVSVM